MINFVSFSLSTLLLFFPLKTFSNSLNNVNREFDWYYSVDKESNTILPPKETPFVNNHKVLFAGDSNEKTLYLTFDEGYENGFTLEILKILNKNKVPAAFFVTNPYIKEHPEIIKEMVAGGHLVCNHSVSHKSMATLANDKGKFEKEFLEVEKNFKEVTGEDMPKFFRPPMGKYSHKSLIETEKLGYSTVLWSFAYKDWMINSQPSKEFAIKKITSKVCNGEVLLLHAVSKTNTEILDTVLQKLKSDGYEFKDLNHLLEHTNNKIIENHDDEAVSK